MPAPLRRRLREDSYLDSAPPCSLRYPRVRFLFNKLHVGDDVFSLLTILWVIGITAEGMTGALAAGRQKMDLFGVSVIASVTAVGGGSIRDMVLGNYPLTWVKDPQYLLLVIGASLVAVSMPFLLENFRIVFLILDAIGLSAFAVIGTEVALRLGHGFIIAVVSAVITGVFGGVMRDLLCSQVPLVFRKELYASVAVLATCVYFVMDWLGSSETATVVTSVCIAVTVRLLAIWRGWSLPVFDYQSRHEALNGNPESPETATPRSEVLPNDQQPESARRWSSE